MSIKCKILAIKLIRHRSGLDLKRSKDIVDIICLDDRSVYDAAFNDLDYRPPRHHRTSGGNASLLPTGPYDDFHFLEKAFESLIIAGRGQTDHRLLAQNAIALSRQMAAAANSALDCDINARERDIDILEGNRG